MSAGAPVLIAYPSSTGARQLNTFLTLSLPVLSTGCVRYTYHLLWAGDCPTLSGPFIVLTGSRGWLLTGAKPWSR